MDFNSNDELRKNGFRGFVPVKTLWMDKSTLPKVKGVYLVINPTYNKPQFISPGVGGFFKGKDPNVTFDELKSNYDAGAQVVYIGKAGSLTGKATLNSRIGQYLRFGQGANIGHYGGRLIWQLKNHADLIFCWKTTPSKEPRELEKELIKDFEFQFGVRPFANLVS